MNAIQKLSYDLHTRRLKLQMGLDPRVDIEPALVREMWHGLTLEEREARARRHPVANKDSFDLD